MSRINQLATIVFAAAVCSARFGRAGRARLFTGIGVNAVGAAVLFAETFRFLGTSL